MEYQILEDGKWKSVYSDGHGMHQDESHGGATFQNVVDGEAHIRIGKGAVRCSNGEEEYSILAYPEANMPDSSCLASFTTEDEVLAYLTEKYSELDCKFDDDYQFGCGNDLADE